MLRIGKTLGVFKIWFVFKVLGIYTSSIYDVNSRIALIFLENLSLFRKLFLQSSSPEVPECVSRCVFVCGCVGVSVCVRACVRVFAVCVFKLLLFVYLNF